MLSEGKPKTPDILLSYVMIFRPLAPPIISLTQFLLFTIIEVSWPIVVKQKQNLKLRS